MTNAVDLAQALIRCPSVTPADAGALDLLAAELGKIGFACHRVRFEEPGSAPIENLYARLGTGGKLFCFAGHTDVVPVGKIDGWSVDPFGGDILNGKLFGRGAADMKGGIAAFVEAAARFVTTHPDFGGSIGLVITGDEEGPAINGTKKLLDWMVARGERMDACIVGEPTNPGRLGEMMKIGRRGSLNGVLAVDGIQGHVAYPDRADNPVPKLLTLLAALGSGHLDKGTAHFQPSNLEITSVDVGNQATNVIPARATAQFNIRFNDGHSGQSLMDGIKARLDATGIAHTLSFQLSGESFVTEPGELSRLISDAAEAVTGLKPDPSTTGGTSDARFITKFCPVVEFGLVGQTMHKTDEHVAVSDIEALVEIYGRVLEGFFA